MISCLIPFIMLDLKEMDSCCLFLHLASLCKSQKKSEIEVQILGSP